MSKRFNVGDIVAVSKESSLMYYLVLDSRNLSLEGDENPSYKYNLIQIYPVLATDRILNLYESSLMPIARFLDIKYVDVMNFIRDKRIEKGLGRPKYLDIINDSKTLYPTKRKNKENKEYTYRLSSDLATSETVNTTTKKTNKRINIEEVLKDKTTDLLLEEYKERMDVHLDLLSIAIQSKDKENINLQKEQLKKVSKTLMELEYFQLEKRRSGTSINIK